MVSAEAKEQKAVVVVSRVGSRQQTMVGFCSRFCWARCWPRWFSQTRLWLGNEGSAVSRVGLRGLVGRVM